MKLKKELNAIDVFSIAAGAMISSGLFVLPAIAYKTTGIGIIYSYLFAGILMLPALFSNLELASAIPKAGGTYFFSGRILGTGAGVIDGFANWFSITLKSTFALIGFGVFFGLFYPAITELHIKLIAAIGCVFFTAINMFGLKSSGKIQVVLVAFLLGILVLFILFGYRVMDFAVFKGMTKVNWFKVISTTGMVFISYGGLTKITSIAEEVKNPQKNLVKGALFAFIIVQAIYILVILIIIGVMPSEKLAVSLKPVTDTSYQFAPGRPIGEFFLIITSAAAFLAFITTANAGIMTASRIPMAMSRDYLLPKFIAKVSKHKKSPYVSIIITSCFMLLIIFALSIENLAKVASLFMLMLFAMVNVSVIVIRLSKISNYKPVFKTPLFPFMQIFGIAGYIFLIFNMGLLTISIASGFIILSLLWHFIYSRKKFKRKSAFIHMVENITAPEIRGEEKELESELLDILIERDEIVEDRFDKIIRNSLVLDLDKPMKRDELFFEVSKAIGERLKLDPKKLLEKFKIREEEASTLIYPGVAVPHAIPHVIIEGRHKFDIVLVRNKSGINWNDKGDIVYTAFSLIGSKDERNFHLRALMFIAQILQDPDFHDEWMNAKNEKELRSVILLTKRKRT